MVTAEELIVSITSEGVADTREDLEGMEESMDNTAESASDSAEDLEEFTQRIEGAMGAALAGVAIGIGALASKVPVLGEIFSGLGAVISAVGLQVDQLLRDLGAGGLTNIFFEAANAIFKLEGAAGDLAGVFGVIGAAIGGAIAGVVGYAASVAVAAGEASAFVATLKTVGTALAGLVTGITATTAAIAIAVAAIAGFAVAYATNFRGVRDTTNRIIGDIISTFMTLGSTLTEWATGVASDAFEWGKNLINRFVDGIRSAIGTLRDFLSDLRDIGARIGIDVPSIDGLGGGGGGGGGGGRGGVPPTTGVGGSAGVSLDGRNLSEDTGRYRADPGRRRGI